MWLDYRGVAGGGEGLKSRETDFGFSGCIRQRSVEAPTSWMFIGKVNCLARCGTVDGMQERDCASAGSPPSIGSVVSFFAMCQSPLVPLGMVFMLLLQQPAAAARATAPVPALAPATNSFLTQSPKITGKPRRLRLKSF